MTSNAVTGPDCHLCGGPCREPFHLPPIHARYPFLSPADIARTQPKEEPPPAPAGGKRMRRPVEDRMHRPQEDRSA